MKLLVLGASGGCGRWLAQLAAERRHQVTALVRPNTPFVAPAGVSVLGGEVLDPNAIEAAVAGQDIVFSCLGLRRAGPSPWARLLSPPDLMAKVARILVAEMRRQRIERLIVVSAGGVGDSAAQLTRPVRWLIGSGHLGTAYRDLENIEAGGRLLQPTTFQVNFQIPAATASVPAAVFIKIKSPERPSPFYLLDVQDEPDRALARLG